MRVRFGSVLGNAGVADFLRTEFYSHGAAQDWRDLLKHATGKPLGVSAYLEELGIRTP